MIEHEGQGCVVYNRKRDRERKRDQTLEALADYKSVGDDSKILIDARANLRVGFMVYSPATRNNVARGGVELKSNRERVSGRGKSSFPSLSRAREEFSQQSI